MLGSDAFFPFADGVELAARAGVTAIAQPGGCLLYTSDAADERSSVDLGGRRIIKKKTHSTQMDANRDQQKNELCVSTH